jgi:hypothetical protein
MRAASRNLLLLALIGVALVIAPAAHADVGVYPQTKVVPVGGVIHGWGDGSGMAVYLVPAAAGPKRRSCGVNGICEPTSKRAPGAPFILLGHLRRTKNVYAPQAFSFEVSPRMIPGLYRMYLYCGPCGNSWIQSGDRLEGETIRVTRKPEVHHFRVGTAPQRIRFLASEPLGVILRLRLTVPHGMHVTATGRIPHLAGVQVSTDRTFTCRRHGGVDVCNQPEEWCPMPAAAWRFVLQKKSGRAGEIRLHFIIGPPPRG